MCKQWMEHENEEFNMHTEVTEDSIMVFDQFTSGTAKEYQREHETTYEIHINFCPFCGTKLNAV